MDIITILKGRYRNQDVGGYKYYLVKPPYKTPSQGTVVSVQLIPDVVYPEYLQGHVGPFRVKITDSEQVVFDSEFVSGSVNTPDPETLKVSTQATTETDQEIKERIQERFNIMNHMVENIRSGGIRAMIISGPPGVGKSHGIMSILEDPVHSAILGDSKVTSVKGFITPVNLYQKLYDHRMTGQILVFDDCDNLLWDEVSCNLLKGALDTGLRRRVSWLSESGVFRKTSDDGTRFPRTFDFNGGVVFITNIDFEGYTKRNPNNKISPHLDALKSRCHYLDLSLNTPRERMLRIEQVVKDQGLLTSQGFSHVDVDDIIQYMWDNMDRLKKLEIRTALQISDYFQMTGTGINWRTYADTMQIKDKRWQ